MDRLDIIAALESALPATAMPREGEPLTVPTEVVIAALAMLEGIDD